MSVEGQEREIERLRGIVADQERKLTALQNILQSVGRPAELPVILKKTLRAALAASGANAGFIHLRESSGKTMRLVSRQNINDSASSALGTISSGDGLVAWVTRNKKALVIPDIDVDPRTVYLANMGSLKVYAGVPISRGAQVWGTLSVLGRDISQFGQEEVALLISVGEEIGVVIENARLRKQAERIALVQERNRLARDLHDSVSQNLYSVTLFAEAGRRTALAEKNSETAEYFDQIGETGHQALKDLRLLIHRLRPSILAKEGLVRALQQRLNAVEGRAGVESSLVISGEATLTPALEEALYQIAQEALNNALKHAMASEVKVALDFTSGSDVILRVEDNGRGFDPEAVTDSDGLGLPNMKERAESFGGELIIRSVVGEGAILEASLKNTGEDTEELQADEEELL
jgi:signal transduction histidine kinase